MDRLSIIHLTFTHSIISVMSLYLFAVFIWWWVQQGRATAIYSLICFMMLGVFAINSGAAFQYAHMWYHGNFEIHTYVGILWPFRNYFMLIPLLLFVIHVTKKIRIDYQLRQLAITDLLSARVANLAAPELVLLVDDNIDAIISIKLMLDRTRFKTVEARDGHEALVLFNRLKDNICCIVLDLVLPELSGWDVLREIRKVSISVPIIISTGYVKGFFGVVEDERDNYCAFLSKPYSPAKLIETIEKCIKGDVYDS